MWTATAKNIYNARGFVGEKEIYICVCVCGSCPYLMFISLSDETSASVDKVLYSPSSFPTSCSY